MLSEDRRAGKLAAWPAAITDDPHALLVARRASYVLCAWIAAAVSAAGQIPQAPAAIDGTVTTQQTTPLAGVSVKIFDATGLLVANVITDESGRFRVANLVGGTYRVIAALEGFETTTVTAVAAAAADASALTIDLPIGQTIAGINGLSAQKGFGPRVRDARVLRRCGEAAPFEQPLDPSRHQRDDVCHIVTRQPRRGLKLHDAVFLDEDASIISAWTCTFRFNAPPKR